MISAFQESIGNSKGTADTIMTLFMLLSGFLFIKFINRDYYLRRKNKRTREVVPKRLKDAHEKEEEYNLYLEEKDSKLMRLLSQLVAESMQSSTQSKNAVGLQATLTELKAIYEADTAHKGSMQTDEFYGTKSEHRHFGKGDLEMSRVGHDSHHFRDTIPGGEAADFVDMYPTDAYSGGLSAGKQLTHDKNMVQNFMPVPVANPMVKTRLDPHATQSHSAQSAAIEQIKSTVTDIYARLNPSNMSNLPNIFHERIRDEKAAKQLLSDVRAKYVVPLMEEHKSELTAIYKRVNPAKIAELPGFFVGMADERDSARLLQAVKERYAAQLTQGGDRARSRHPMPQKPSLVPPHLNIGR